MTEQELREQWPEFMQDMDDIDRAMNNYCAYMDAEMFILDFVGGLEHIPHGREALAHLMRRKPSTPPSKRVVNLDA